MYECLIMLTILHPFLSPVQMTPGHPSFHGLSAPTQLETPDSDKSGISEADTSTATTTSSMPSPGVVDQDLAHMEAQLDNWTLELKRNVLVRVDDE